MKYLFFDIETTGLDKETDQIIEIAFIARWDGNERNTLIRVRPTVEIAASATEVHGITIQDLADAPTFDQVAEQVSKSFAWADVVIGYNVEFDCHFAERQLKEHGFPGAFEDKIVLDPYRIWMQQEPRKLLDAVSRFTDLDVAQFAETAHGALPDTKATAAVYDGVLRTFGLEEKTIHDLEAICYPDRALWVAGTYHFVWHEGIVLVNFGKLKDQPLADNTDDSYWDWVLRSDFPLPVKEYLRFARDVGVSALDEVTAEHYLTAEKRLRAQTAGLGDHLPPG